MSCFKRQKDKEGRKSAEYLQHFNKLSNRAGNGLAKACFFLFAS